MRKSKKTTQTITRTRTITIATTRRATVIASRFDSKEKKQMTKNKNKK